MKLAIVLLAVVAAVSAHPGLGWDGGHVAVAPAPAWPAPVSVWPAPEPAWHAPAPAWHAPAPAWPAPQPAYVKKVVSVPVIQHQAPVHHQHVVSVPQQPPIPALHPQPLNIKVPHTQSVRLPLGHVHISQPHLIGYEVHAPEPVVKIAKHAPAHPW